MVQHILFLALGGVTGTLLRYGTGLLVMPYNTSAFPWGTVAVNLVGSFIIGTMWGVFEGQQLATHFRLFLFTGLLGSFTTFSTFSLETMNLLRDGQWGIALANVLFSVLAGLALAFAGFYLGRHF